MKELSVVVDYGSSKEAPQPKKLWTLIPLGKPVHGLKRLPRQFEPFKDTSQVQALGGGYKEPKCLKKHTDAFRKEK